MNKLLLISLLAGSFYNFDNTVLRIIALGCWIFSSSFLFFFYFPKMIINRNNSEILFVLLSYFLLLLCWLVNSDSLEIELSGVSVEMLTPLLYVFHLLNLLVVLYLVENKKLSVSIIQNFFVLAILIIFIDMVVRYIEAPSLFLNYNERFQAKNTGFFSNTNVLGQTIAFLIVILNIINIKFKRFMQLILLILLLSTMARSAFISVILVYFFSLLWEKGKLYKILAMFILFSFIILFSQTNLINDGSFLSKISFLESTYNLILEGKISEIIFGYGASFDVITNKLNVNGYSPHISILKAFLYYGLIGTVFFILILYRMYSVDNKFFYPIITFVIFSFAGAPIYWPTLTTGLILIIISNSLEKKI